MPTLIDAQPQSKAAVTSTSDRSKVSTGRATPITPSPAPKPVQGQGASPGFDLKLFSRGVIDFRRHAGRDVAALLCERAAYLVPADRTLVEGVFRDGHTLFELARLLPPADAPGVPRATVELVARRLARHLKSVIRRVMSPLFAFVAARVDRARAVGDSDAWPLERRRIAEAIVLHGLSVRDTAALLATNTHRVREHRRAVEAMFAGASS